MGQRLGQMMLGMPGLMESMEQAFYNRAVWQLKFVWWPKRCSLSNRWIWPLSHAYKGTAIWQGPGPDAVEVVWHDDVEHLVWLLKGNNK
jgi:hypothetical protein